MAPGTETPLARILRAVAKVEPREVKAVSISFVYFFFLMFGYFVVKPVRDAMGTVYGVAHLQELFTGTFVVSFVVAPIYAGVASRVKLSKFLPWVYGFIAVTMVIFFALFQLDEKSRWIAAAFYVWVSTFNLLTISVFWSFMADMYSPTQAKRLFGFVAAGGTVGTITGPAIGAIFVNMVGANNLLLVSAAGFVITALLVNVLEKEKQKLLETGADTQKTTLDRKLGGNPFSGFATLLKSPYLMMIALFILLMTTISTVIYFQLSDAISKAFETRDARTQAFAVIDLAVNSLTVFIQLFGTGRFIQRFGVTAGLLINPVIMLFAFLAVAFAPVLAVLGTIQVVRRFAEYAVAKPSREMLFTVVDQQSKYKAKNVIDTVVYRLGDLTSAWLSAAILPFGVVGLAIAGIVISAIWFPIAYKLGRKYESARASEGIVDAVGKQPAAATS